jgi:amino acid transporter
MRILLIVYATILILGTASMLLNNHYLANIAGFISAIVLLLVFFKDRPDDELPQDKKIRQYWYVVVVTGLLFSLLFGSLWNSHIGNM